MSAAVDLYWLPLGAGGRSVRLNGRLFEAVSARLHHRTACDLYHSGLEVSVDGERYVIEMAPAWDARGAARGAVAEGPVGARWAGRSRLFRYEIRRWRDGEIPDVAEAVDSPQRLSEDPAAARRLLALVPSVPAMTWGRDPLRTGDMWNSNSVVSWLLAESGVDPTPARLPDHGRAPGWEAGLAAAARSAAIRERRRRVVTRHAPLHLERRRRLRAGQRAGQGVLRDRGQDRPLPSGPRQGLEPDRAPADLPE